MHHLESPAHRFTAAANTLHIPCVGNFPQTYNLPSGAPLICTANEMASDFPFPIHFSTCKLNANAHKSRPADLVELPAVTMAQLLLQLVNSSQCASALSCV